jgi:thiopurine S-methyltransferase
MEPDFWRKRWHENKIGFHESDTNPLLVRHFDALSLSDGARVFIPLCGKTLDIRWLLAKGYRVVGAELVETAIQQLFDELGAKPSISETGQFKHYSAENIDIFVGDIFNLSSDLLGSVDAVYDRAALVALPEDMRKRYSAHLMKITAKAPQLLLSFEYDQSLVPGPPFSVGPDEVHDYYEGHYTVSLAELVVLQGGLKGKYDCLEAVWLLTRP